MLKTKAGRSEHQNELREELPPKTPKTRYRQETDFNISQAPPTTKIKPYLSINMKTGIVSSVYVLTLVLPSIDRHKEEEA